MHWIKSASFARILPFAVYIFFLTVDDFFSFNPNHLYLFKIALVSLVLVFFFHQYAELKTLKNISFSAYLVSIIIGIAVFLIWILPFPKWAIMGDIQESFVPLNSDKSVDLTLVFIRIFGAALVVPIMEELFWRSFLMRWVDHQDFLKVTPQNVSAYAFIITSCMFAIEHQLWLAGLFAGFAYGYLYMKYNNIWIPIFAHAMTNGLLGIWVVTTHQWKYW